MPKGNGDQLLEMACMHEEKLEKLYTTLSEQFPDDSEFWNELAQEERQHNAAFRQVKAALGTGALRLDESALRLQAIQSAIDYIEAITRGVERKRYPYVKVLSEIWDFQQNLLESGLFWGLQVPAGKAFPVLERLTQETEQHRVKLEQKWQQEKKKAAAL
jgi:rubrerythrin